MHTILQPLFILLFIGCLFAGRTAILAAIGKDVLSAVLFGIAALLALIAMIFMAFV
jgi:hypothetical protein